MVLFSGLITTLKIVIEEPLIAYRKLHFKAQGSLEVVVILDFKILLRCFSFMMILGETFCYTKCIQISWEFVYYAHMSTCSFLRILYQQIGKFFFSIWPHLIFMVVCLKWEEMYYSKYFIPMLYLAYTHVQMIHCQKPESQLLYSEIFIS